MTETTETKSRPILFSGEMVRAIIQGRKTQTRRAIDRMKGFRCKQFGPSDTKGYDWHFRCQRGLWQDMDHAEVISRCPYGQVGDRLWVRETWRVSGDLLLATEGMTTSEAIEEMKRRHIRCEYDEADVCYAADEYPNEHPGEYKPSIFMPRIASRILLEIVSVRIEQLQNISEPDAIAEGVDLHGPIGNIVEEMKSPGIYHFANLWETINGAGAWDANPWVWVVEFEVAK